MVFECTNCSYSAPTVSKYLSHCKFHKNQPNISFSCCFADCKCTFSNFTTLKVHVSRTHNQNQTPSQPCIPRSLNAVALAHGENISHFKCARLECSFLFNSFDELKVHLKRHLQRNEEIDCPYSGCQAKFKKKSSFSSHLTRKHSNATLHDLSSLHVAQSCATDSIVNTSDTPDTNLTERNETTDASNENEMISFAELNDTDFEISEDTDRNFLNSLATFYLQLQGKLLLPSSTIQLIISEFQEMHEVSQSLMLKKVGEKLQILDMPADVISDIQRELQDSDLFSLCNKGPLQTAHKRNSFFKQNFGYTRPAEILIDYDKYNNPKTYQYIPICDSLQNLYKHFQASFKFVRPTDDASHPSVLSDIFDGSVFQKNALFLREEKTFQIILYQDAFEVVNPLGSAKKKHKLVGVYYTLANFEVDKRSNIDHMQLVLLCRETDLKEFTPKKVFRKLVEDLKKLEQHGVNMGDTNIKGTLFCIVGDNLGSHMIGGYQESFVAKYFCRYCEFSRDDGELSLRGASRTVGKYRETVQYVEENETTHIGIKSDSLFNTLTFYHVAMPGLPPCLGHDLFEGIVAYDMALIINHLVDMHWFTYSQLNRKLDTFIYSGLDAIDKPPAFSPKAEKLGGHAVQNWVFLRIFSLLIGKYVEDTDNCIWQLYLSLKNIVQIVCSPKLPLSQIAYLNVCIDEYLLDRKKLFPDTPLRPKHHYLLHYPELTISFGPLIHLWTMRFESKHTYFKRCARQLHNYKHLAKTLACRHQLLQAYYASGSLFKNPLVIHDQAVPFHNHLYNQAIQNSVQSLDLNATNTQVSMKVSCKGIMYSPDEVVVLGETESCLLLGKICFLLVKGENLWLSICSIQASPLPAYGLYMCDFTAPTPSSYQCVNPLSLNNPFPIPVYQVDNIFYISLKTCYT